jgi:hypothetical protein
MSTFNKSKSPGKRGGKEFAETRMQLEKKERKNET